MEVSADIGTLIIRNQISKIMGIKPSGPWKIVDSVPDKGLYMIHYNENANLSEWGWIKGIVVDVKTKLMVAKSFSYLTEIVTEKITQNNDESVSMTDEFGTIHNFQPEEMVLKRGFEGTIVTVFKHDGVVYHSNRHRFDISNFRWGNSPNFESLYTQYGGPKDEDLFNTNYKYSPYCHVFIISSPDLLIS